VRIFPNPKSCLRLASALLKEWHEDWITGRHYLRMEELPPSDSPAPERMAA
jgi:putative transposase